MTEQEYNPLVSKLIKGGKDFSLTEREKVLLDYCYAEGFLKFVPDKDE